MMDEKTYRMLVDETLSHIDRAFEPIDPDLAESSISQGALTILFSDGLRAIVSPQPPVRQMWLAFRDRGYHFNWDGARWIDDKESARDLYATIREIIRAKTGQDVPL
jgi:CyaY protein